MRERDLDYMLVPLGLAVMTAYPAWLLRRILKQPTGTVVGINGINRRIWVIAMMEIFRKPSSVFHVHPA